MRARHRRAAEEFEIATAGYWRIGRKHVHTRGGDVGFEEVAAPARRGPREENEAIVGAVMRPTEAMP